MGKQRDRYSDPGIFAYETYDAMLLQLASELVKAPDVLSRRVSSSVARVRNVPSSSQSFAAGDFTTPPPAAGATTTTFPIAFLSDTALKAR